MKIVGLIALVALVWSAKDISAFAQESPSPGTAGSAPPTARPSAEPTSRSRQTPSTPKEKPREEPRVERRETQQQEPPASPQPAVAGTWRGTMAWNIWGDVEFTLMVSSDLRSVSSSSRLGKDTHAATYDGRTLAFRGGMLKEIHMTVTPASDGRTAIVSARSFGGLGINSTAVFQKISNVTAPAVVRQSSSSAKQVKPARRTRR